MMIIHDHDLWYVCAYHYCNMTILLHNIIHALYVMSKHYIRVGIYSRGRFDTISIKRLTTLYTCTLNVMLRAHTFSGRATATYVISVILHKYNIMFHIGSLKLLLDVILYWTESHVQLKYACWNLCPPLENTATIKI